MTNVDIIVGLVLLISLFLLFNVILAFVWKCTAFRPFKHLCHDIYGWHEPADKVGFDGASFTAVCKYCGKPILQDSQGNWF